MDQSETPHHFFAIHAAVILVFVALLMVLAWQATVNSPYQYDEADYMHVARLGLRANYTDSPTMPIKQFFHNGLSRGPDARQRSQLSELIRGTDDIIFYRHWNGPVYFYWLMLTSHLHFDERQMRLLTVAFPICGVVTIYLGCLWIFGGVQGAFAAIVSSALFVWSVPAVRSTELAPHQAFVCSYLICLIFLAKTLATGKRSYFYYAVVAAALGCCLLEVGFVAVATVIVCGYLERKRLDADWSLAGRALLAFVATVLVVWPGALLKLSFLKGYAFMAYISLFRKSPWGQEGLLQTWEKRVLSSPVEWLIIGAALLAWFFLRDRFPGDWRLMYPFLIFGALMFAITLRVTTGAPRYALVFEPSLDVLAGCIAAGYLLKYAGESRALLLTAGIACLMFAETWINLVRHPVVPDTRLVALLDYVRENHLESSRLLVPQTDLPTLPYYFPNTRLRGYTEAPPEVSELRQRLGEGLSEGLIYPGYPIRYQPPSSRGTGQ